MEAVRLKELDIVSHQNQYVPKQLELNGAELVIPILVLVGQNGAGGLHAQNRAIKMARAKNCVGVVAYTARAWATRLKKIHVTLSIAPWTSGVIVVLHVVVVLRFCENVTI